MSCTELKKKRSLHKAGGKPTAIAALLASRVAASVLLRLVCTRTTELILIGDQRSVVSTAQSVTIIDDLAHFCRRYVTLRLSPLTL